MIRDEITLDLLRTTSQCVISAKLGVTDREIAIKLREGAEPYFPDGVTAVLSATTPVGTTLYNDCRIENNTIYYSFTEATTGAVGAYDAEIILYRGEGVLASASFTIVVEKRASDPAIIVKSDEFTALDKMVTEGSKLYGDTKKIKEQTETLYENTENLYNELTSKTNNWGIDNTFNPESEYAQSGKAISQYTNNTFANAITDNISGNGVSIRDISPVEHTLNVKARSKNIIPYPYYETTKTLSGIKFTDNGDCSISVDKTANDNAYFTLVNKNAKNLYLEKGQTYTLNVLPVSGSYSTIYSYLIESDGTEHYELVDSVTFTANSSGYASISFVVAKGFVADNLLIKPQLEVGSTATPYAPYVADLSAVQLQRYGGNILPNPYYYTSRTLNGVTFTVNEDTSITMKGIPTANTYFYLVIGKNFGVSSMNAGQNKSATNGEYTLSKWLMYYAKDEETYIYIPKDTAVDETIYPQLCKGTVLPPYDPPQEPTTYPVNADGTVDGVKSIYPTTTLIPNTDGVVIDAEYIVDTKKYINKKIAEAAI